MRRSIPTTTIAVIKRWVDGSGNGCARNACDRCRAAGVCTEVRLPIIVIGRRIGRAEAVAPEGVVGGVDGAVEIEIARERRQKIVDQELCVDQ